MKNILKNLFEFVVIYAVVGIIASITLAVFQTIK